MAGVCGLSVPVGAGIDPLKAHALFDLGHFLAGHPGRARRFLFQGERLGRASAVLPGVAVPSRSPASGPMHPADANASNGARAAVQPAQLRLGAASQRLIFPGATPSAGACCRCGIDVLGRDYSAAARELVSQKGLPFETVDLTTRAAVPGSPWDLAVCCEVAEHLDARHAGSFVENLTSASATVFLTAAECGQAGLNHVNEPPNSHWIGKEAKFDHLGFTLDGNLTEKARAAFAEGEVVHYLENL